MKEIKTDYQLKTPETFTSEEAWFIKPFFTNLDKNVFAAKYLPSEVLGAMASRYSRSSKGVRRLFYDEYIKPILEPNLEGAGASEARESEEMKTELVKFVSYLHEGGGWDKVVNSKRARDFFSRWLAAYGDDSIAQMAGAHIFYENISSLACDFLQDFRIGLAPLEKSTRYVMFDKKQDGKYLYWVDEDLNKSEFGGEYLKNMNMLFRRYSDSIEPLAKYLHRKYPQGKDQTDRAYRETIKAKTCDVLRAYLPVATLTNSGFFGVGQSLEYMLTKSYTSPILEVRQLAKAAQSELNQIIPSLVDRATSDRGKIYQQYVKKTEENLQKLSRNLDDNQPHIENVSIPSSSVDLIEWDNDAENRIVASLLYKNSNFAYARIKQQVFDMSAPERLEIIKEAAKLRQVRQHRLVRSFENTYYKFEIVANIGAYRDLHRHRMQTQERQLFTTDLGYDVPGDLIDAKLEGPYVDACEKIGKFYQKIAPEFPNQAQYIVTRGHRVRWYQFQNLRELAWESELRTGSQGHLDYRKVEHQKIELVKKIHPALIEALKFVDFNDYELARRESEIRIDKKLDKLKR